MNSNTNDKFNVAGDRPLGAAKPVDPATRLSELLAQSLEELTRPFDPPRVDPLTRAQPVPPHAAGEPTEPPHVEPDAPVVTTGSRLDDRQLAELEAELFAARAPAGERMREAEAPHDAPPAEEPHDDAPPLEAPDDPSPADLDQPAPSLDIAPGPFGEAPQPPAPPAAPAEPMNADATRVIAKVRRLMLFSMLVTLIAVGSVFGFIGYRVYRIEGTPAKTVDKLPAPAIPNDMMLALPRGARIVQAAVAEDRLIITLEIGGKIEARTFDLKTLQPAGRLTFSTTP